MKLFREIALNESMVKVNVYKEEKTKTPLENVVPLKKVDLIAKSNYKVEVIDSKDKVTIVYIKGEKQ